MTVGAHAYYLFEHNECFGASSYRGIPLSEETIIKNTFLCEWLTTAYALSFPENPSRMDGFSRYLHDGLSVHTMRLVRDGKVYNVKPNGEFILLK